MSGKYPSTAAITKTLIELGFRNRSRTVDGYTEPRQFCVRPLTVGGERMGAYVVFFLPEDAQRAIELKDEIETRTEELGFPFTVTPIRYGKDVSIRNY